MGNKEDYLPISAEYARNKTEKIVVDKSAKQLKEIFQKIHTRIKEGEYYLDFKEPLAPCNESILKKYGYKIIYPCYSRMVPIAFYIRIDWSGSEFKGINGGT